MAALSSRLRPVKSSTKATDRFPPSSKVAEPSRMGTRLPSFRKYSFSIGSRTPVRLCSSIHCASRWRQSGGQILPVHAARREVLTVVSDNPEKRVVGLENPTIEVPEEDADYVGFHKAPNLRFALCEIAVQTGILGHVHQRSGNLQVAGCILQSAAQHMYKLH